MDCNVSKMTALRHKDIIRTIPEEAGMYPSDDIPSYIKKLAKRLEKKERARRTDLVKGNVVVVLEGCFAAKRVVFLKQVENNKALCCGPKIINDVPFFLIDERYLLRTSTTIDFERDVDIDTTNIFKSERNQQASEFIDVDLTKEEVEIENAIFKAVCQIRFMKKYLSTPFNVPMFKSTSSLKF